MENLKTKSKVVMCGEQEEELMRHCDDVGDLFLLAEDEGARFAAKKAHREVVKWFSEPERYHRKAAEKKMTR